MSLKRRVFFACLVCLILASSVLAQDDVIPTETVKVVRLHSSSLPADFNLTAWLETGDFGLTAPVNNEKKAVPGPAPAPYPTAKIWDKGIEQLGASFSVCDGITFVNGPNWVPTKEAVILWIIRIPNPSMRLSSEFERDLTLQLWVDWNENRAWDRNERVICENLNVRNLFPSTARYIEVQYLTSFIVPYVGGHEGGSGAMKYETKVWARGGLTYDDNDASPAGQALFGEYEDYQLLYQVIQTGTKTKG
jgi:GEVED domain